GSYTGKLYMIPDRGWNTQGTTDFRGRLQRFDVTLNPFYGAGPTDQNKLTMRFKKSILLYQSGGIPTTGLDPSGVRPAIFDTPDLPVGPNGHVSFDGEAVVHVGDGTVWVSDEYGPYIYHYTLDGTLLRVIRPPEAFIPMRKDASGNLVENFSANSPPGNHGWGRQNKKG